MCCAISFSTVNLAMASWAKNMSCQFRLFFELARLSSSRGTYQLQRPLAAYPQSTSKVCLGQHPVGHSLSCVIVRKGLRFTISALLTWAVQHKHLVSSCPPSFRCRGHSPVKGLVSWVAHPPTSPWEQGKGSP